MADDMSAAVSTTRPARKRVTVFRKAEAVELDHDAMPFVAMDAGVRAGFAKLAATGGEVQTCAQTLVLFKEPGDEGMSLVYAWFRSGFVLPRHSHDDDCLCYVIGGSLLGARASLAHTASKSGDDGWYDGFLRECGVTRVRSLSEMVDTTRVLTAEVPIPPSPRIAVLTVSGGAGVLICDEAARYGLSLADFPASLAQALRSFLHGFAQAQNPVDVTGAVVSVKALMARALTTLAKSEACDAILLFIGSMASIADNLIDAIAEAKPIGKPMVVIWMAAPPGARDRVEAAGVPVFAEIQPAVVALARASGLTDRG